MSENNTFYEELLVLANGINAIRFGADDILPEKTLQALSLAEKRLGDRIVEILEEMAEATAIARGETTKDTEPGRVATTTLPVSSPSTTVPENTSSQPSPSDLAGHAVNTTTGA